MGKLVMNGKLLVVEGLHAPLEPLSINMEGMLAPLAALATTEEGIHSPLVAPATFEADVQLNTIFKVNFFLVML